MKVRAIDGKPIIDAKRPITIHITPGDIAKADRKEAGDCAVARCLRRETHAKEVRVHLGRVYVRANESNWQRFITPKSLRSEIIAFDRGGAFEPGEFTLSAPQPTKRLNGKRQGTKPTKAGRRTGRNRTRHVVTDVRTGPA